jgi:cysteinyl-tRNA synthetase
MKTVPLRLFNSLTRKKAIFKPLDKFNVRMYVCGPTVYDYAHIGNARPVIVFDVLSRILCGLYGEQNVTYVRNITDVDDKIIKAQQESGEDIETITSRTIIAFHEDMNALGNLAPDIEPLATDHIPEMQELIRNLLAKGHAYSKEGHVLFDVNSMPDYGKLSKLKGEELIAGARVEVAPYKRNPADFVLWKPSDKNQPGWHSPWGPNDGRGRPGWHIECSAMSEKYLGKTFDIHGGGIDLIFPHHENELAQSCSANNPETFAQIWMHNGYLMVEGEKMSKSIGNYITVRNLLDEYHGETIRLCMLSTHYRQPLNWTDMGLARAKDTLDRWYGALSLVDGDCEEISPSPDFQDALLDDLNTPLAISVIHKTVSTLYKSPSKINKATLLAAAKLIGLLCVKPEDWFKWQPKNKILGLTDAKIDALIQERTKAREKKDFEAADNIRGELAVNGIILEDGSNGTTWKRH